MPRGREMRCLWRVNLIPTVKPTGVLVNTHDPRETFREEEDGMEPISAQQATGLPDDGYVRLPTILKYLAISKTTFYAGIRAGIFPKPHKLSKRTSVWRASEIRQIVYAQ